MNNNSNTTIHQEIKTNGAKAWLLAARPQTLSGAAVPVMIGIAMAYQEMSWENFQLIPALLCLLFAFIMQIDANFINDYFDCLKGNDKSETRLGPKRACSEGWITLSAMKKGIIATTFIASLCGLPLIYYGGWEMILVGIICIVFCFLYTTKLSYLGLGDVLVLIFFGIIPVCLTYYVCQPAPLQTITWSVLGLGVTCGLIVDTLLLVNNYRDFENDRQAGKITLVVRIGQENTEKLYEAIALAVPILTFAFITDFDNYVSSGLATMMNISTAFLMINTLKKMKCIKKGRALNEVLGETARNMLIYGILTTATIIIPTFFN